MNTKEAMQELIDGKTLTWVNVIDGRWGSGVKQFFIKMLPNGEILHTQRMDEFIPELRTGRWEIFDDAADQYGKGVAELKLLRELRETEENNGKA